jgi:hypothetical protein
MIGDLGYFIFDTDPPGNYLSRPFPKPHWFYSPNPLSSVAQPFVGKNTFSLRKSLSIWLSTKLSIMTSSPRHLLMDMSLLRHHRSQKLIGHSNSILMDILFVPNPPMIPWVREITIKPFREYQY